MSQAPFGSGAPTPGEGNPLVTRTPPPPARGGRRAAGTAVPPRVIAFIAVGILAVGGLAWFVLGSNGSQPLDATGAGATPRAASASGSASASASGSAIAAAEATRNPFVGGPQTGGAGAGGGTNGGGSTSTSTSSAPQTTAAPTTAVTTPASTPTVTVKATTTKTVTATATPTSVYVFLSAWVPDPSSGSESAKLWVNASWKTLAAGQALGGVTFVSKDATSGCAMVKLSSGGTSKPVCVGDAVQLA